MKNLKMHFTPNEGSYTELSFLVAAYSSGIATLVILFLSLGLFSLSILFRPVLESMDSYYSKLTLRILHENFKNILLAAVLTLKDLKCEKLNSSIDELEIFTE